MRNGRLKGLAKQRELFGGFRRNLLKRVVFDNNEMTAKWRHWLCRITRAQNGKGFRSKGEREQDRECRILHSLTLMCINRAIGLSRQHFLGDDGIMSMKRKV
jgi:hypothetical protein